MSGNALADLAPLLSDAAVAARLTALQVDTQAMPPAFPAGPAGQLAALRTLVLRDVQLAAETWPMALASLAPALTSLALDGNQLTLLLEGWLTSNGSVPAPPLQRLSLRGNQLAVLVAGVFDTLAATLIALDVHGNGLAALPAGLLGTSFPRLAHVYVHPRLYMQRVCLCGFICVLATWAPMR